MIGSCEVRDRLSQYLVSRMEATRTPAVTIALFGRVDTPHVLGLGVADVGMRTPVDDDTLFAIGSITKSFTAIAILQAADAGLLDVWSPVTEYLPWFHVQAQDGPITLHHLLTHTAGLIGVMDQSPDTRSAVWALRRTVAAWPPGSRFYYSDAGYQILALVLEAVTGRTFADVIRRDILDPVGMVASEPVLTHTIRPRMATGYRHLYDDRPHHSSDPVVPASWIETSSGDCCIASTAADMAKYGQMLLNGGRVPDGGLLHSESFDLMKRCHSSPGWCDYGYGLEIHHCDESTQIGHGGVMPGYESMLMAEPQSGLGVVILSTQPSVSVRDLAPVALRLWRHASVGESIASVDLPLPDPTHVANAAEYAGTYCGGDTELVFSADGPRLLLHHKGERLVAERRSGDRFYVRHPDFSLFLIGFERADANTNSSPTVTGAYYAGDAYTKEGHAHATGLDYPPMWPAYLGHYRAHNPWEQSNFRVILRSGTLWLVWPTGEEEPLAPLPDDVFRVGDDMLPERLRFDQVVGGQALRARLSGTDYYRFFTP